MRNDKSAMTPATANRSDFIQAKASSPLKGVGQREPLNVSGNAPALRELRPG
jgi:hypothetical protein